MKTKLAALAILLASAAQAADKSVTLAVAGWHSKGDVLKTETAVRAVKGVKSASSDLTKKQLSVIFDDAVATQAQVEGAVSEAGYTIAR